MTSNPPLFHPKLSDYPVKAHPLKYQVSGHSSILSISDKIVLKPAIPLEYGIYKYFQSHHTDFRQFLPYFFKRCHVKFLAYPARNIPKNFQKHLQFDKNPSSSSNDSGSTDSRIPNNAGKGLTSESQSSAFTPAESTAVSDPTSNVVIKSNELVFHKGIHLYGPLEWAKISADTLTLWLSLNSIPDSLPVTRRIKIKRLKNKSQFNHKMWLQFDSSDPTSWTSRKFSFDLREIVSDGSNEYFQYLMLENLIQGLDKPCILDLKLGFRQHSDDAKITKVESQIKKCLATTSGSHAIRFCGSQVFHEESNAFLYIDKYIGRDLDIHSLQEVIENFFVHNNTIQFSLLVPVLNKLRQCFIAGAKLDRVRLFGVSLLFLYDAQPFCINSVNSNPVIPKLPAQSSISDSLKPNILSPSTLESTNSEDPGHIPNRDSVCSILPQDLPEAQKTIDIRLIDFAHSYPSYPFSGPDYGLLFGLRNVWHLLFKILKKSKDPALISAVDQLPDISLNMEQAKFEARWYNGCDHTLPQSMKSSDK